LVISTFLNDINETPGYWSRGLRHAKLVRRKPKKEGGAGRIREGEGAKKWLVLEGPKEFKKRMSSQHKRRQLFYKNSNFLGARTKKGE